MGMTITPTNHITNGENMKTSHMIAIIVVLTIAGIAFFSTRSDRADAIDRVSDAAKALNGKADDTPDIVKEQRKRERERQNSKWTLENQRKHPLEYCRAMLEQLDSDDKELDVSLHKYQTAQLATKRQIDAEEIDVKKYTEFLGKAKPAYRTAEAAAAWPASFNGRELTQKAFQDYIIDANERLQAAQSKLPELKLRLETLAKREAKAVKSQKEISALREKFQGMIRDIEMNRIGAETGNLDDSLGALRDSLSALGQSDAVRNDDDIFAPSADEERISAFDAIMEE